MVRPADLPELKLAKDEARVVMKVSCGGLWTKEAVLPVSGAPAEHLFLQTDKPIYQPGSTGEPHVAAFSAPPDSLRF